MVMLKRKMLRDIWKNKVPFFAIFFMMFAGNFIFSGITSEYNGMSKCFDSYIEETNLADVWVTGMDFEESDIKHLKSQPNITQVDKRMLLKATLKDDENKSIDLYAFDQVPGISKIQVTEGMEYDEYTKGIWLDAAFAKANQFELHDTITLNVNSETIEKEIVGLCRSPEYIYHTKDGGLVPDHKYSGFAMMNRQDLIQDGPVNWNQLLITGNGNIEKTIQDIFGTGQKLIVMQKDHPSYSMIKDEIKQHKEIGLIFAAVFLLIAVLVTITTVHRLLSSQQLQTGILKATGFCNRQLYIHYISHSTLICLTGAFTGWCAGYAILPKILFPIMEEMYVMPELRPVMPDFGFCLPILCAFLCLIVSVMVCQTYLRGNAASILYSNSTGKKYKELWFSTLFGHLSFYGQWNIRDIFRNKLRSIMTILGVVGCVSLLFSSMGLYTSMNYMSDWTFGHVQTFDIKITGDFTDQEFKNKLQKSMEGEELMEASAKLAFNGKEKTVSFTGIESQKYFHLFDLRDMETDLKTGVAISRNTALEMNIKTGDKIKWKFPGQRQWFESSVTRIIRTPMSQGIFMKKGEMQNKNIPFQVTSIIGNNPDTGNLNLNQMDSVQNKSNLKSGLDAMLKASLMLCAIFLVMAVLLGSVILYNLGTLSYMERYRDMATLKVLGFDDKRIKRLMVQQNLWLTITGILIGLPAGYGLVVLMLKTVQSSIDIRAYTPFPVYVVSLLGTWILSLIISKLLSKKVCHIDMAAALKANE